MSPYPYMVYDTETTGLPDFKAPSTSPHQPHLCEVSALLYDRNDLLIDRYEALVRPDGWDISAEAQAIHQIPMEKMVNEGLPEKQVIEGFLKFHKRAGIRVGHNESFDARIIRIGILRYLDEGTAAEWKSAPSFCTCATARARKVSPTNGLQMVYKSLIGKTMGVAHRAHEDAEACAEIYRLLR